MFNAFYRYALFFIVPGFVLGYSFLIRIAAGPQWLGTNQDPSYPCLLNGVRILQGSVPYDIVHPGTSLQLLIAAVCGLMNFGCSASQAATHVFMAPEFYLKVIFIVLSLLSFITSVALAVYIYQKTGDTLASLLSQLPALGFYYFKYGLWHVCGECLLISVINLFSLCLLKVYFANSFKEENRATLWWGMVCGLGVAEKVTVVPLLIIPLIVLSLKNKITFILIFLASFIVCTYPIISKYPFLLVENFKIMTHLGHQGAGPAGVIEIHTYLSNWQQIIALQGMYVGLLCIASVLCLLKLAFKKWDKGTFFLAAIALGILCQFAVVAKHPGGTYVLAGLGMFNSLLVFLYLQGPFKSVPGQQFIIVIILACVLIRTWQTNEYRIKLTRQTNDVLAFYKHIHDKYSGLTFINYYSASEPQAALFMGEENTGLFDELYRLYPKSYSFNRWSYQIFNFKQRVLSDDILAQNSGVILLGDEFDFSTTPFSTRLLEKGPTESVYLLTNTTEKQALMFHRQAQIYRQLKDDLKALACENHAKVLHYQAY